MEENNNLYIPANIRTRLEFFKGYGVKELVTTILVVAFSLPVIFLIYKLKSTLAAIIVFLIIIATSVITNVKDDNNLCVATQVKFMIKNTKMQRKYDFIIRGGNLKLGLLLKINFIIYYCILFE